MKPARSVAALAAVALFGASNPYNPSEAEPVMEYVILVAPRDTPAAQHAAGAANGETVFAERRFFRGLAKAAELLGQPGAGKVTVKVAAGQYTGQANKGTWEIPAVSNPEATLHILGGYDDSFSTRDPFARPVELVTIRGRDGALLQVSQRSTLKELVISGFLFDAAPSNSYDTQTNSIQKGQSRTYPLISFSQLITDHLVVADNVFLNGAHGAFDPYIGPMSASAVVDIQNNFFLNNIKTMKPAGVPHRGNTISQINLTNNSFILGWPFNPDQTSSDVGTLNLYHTDGAKALNIRGNLFAFNPGGAMQHDWPEDRMPELTIESNLFFMNAGLFENGAPDAGIFVGKFGTNPRYLILDMVSAEDDFGYTVTNNVSIDPQVQLAMVPLEAADSYSVERKNTVLNDVRQIFGLNQDGGTVAIANYAPRLAFDPGLLPVPHNTAAQQYGVQPNHVFGGN